MATVTVASKLPFPFILDVPGKARIEVRGVAVPYGTPPVIVPGGYVLTPDLDEETVMQWFKLYENSDMVKNHALYVMAKSVDARAKSKEMAEIRTGLEPLEIHNDPRIPKSKNPVVPLER
jgi:hypothetical protein